MMATSEARSAADFTLPSALPSSTLRRRTAMGWGVEGWGWVWGGVAVVGLRRGCVPRRSRRQQEQQQQQNVQDMKHEAEAAAAAAAVACM